MAYVQELAFVTDSEDFALGFEAARVWHTLIDNAHPGCFTVHAANAEMMLRIAEATGYTVSSEDVDDRWITVRFDEAAL